MAEKKKITDELFKFLEPGNQEPKVQIPYRAPAETNSYITKSLKPGEVVEKTPVGPKDPDVDITAKIEGMNGGKKKVVGEKFDIKKPIDVDGTISTPEPTPVEAEPTIPDYEPLIIEKTKDLPHVEGKMIRNAEVLKQQQESTKKVSPESSVWDEIWPALVPVALNALIGDGTYEDTFAIAADTLEKIQAEKKAARKPAGKGGLSFDQQIALEKEKNFGRRVLEQDKIGGRGELQADKYGRMDNLDTGKQYQANMYKRDQKAAEQNRKLNLTPVVVKGFDPTTGKEKNVTMTMDEYLYNDEGQKIPPDQRRQMVQKGTSGAAPKALSKSFVKDGVNTTIFYDNSGKEINRTVMPVGDSSPMIAGLTNKQTKVLEPMLKDFRKDASLHIENAKKLTTAAQMLRSDNIYENTQAIFSIIKQIEGRMTDEDAQRYTTPIDHWGKLLATAKKEKNGQYPKELLEGFQNAVMKGIRDAQNTYKNLPSRYLGYAKNATKNLGLRDEQLSGLFKTPGMEDTDYKKMGGN